ncbi:diacylglycerol acyltransferase [Nitzschia inconspicua]|uniref:Acyltransferase n=1 Tax=Nitzschia inconspicua TaxID=303405 RepID=A0A9K3KJL1_9STRA|nr:diacylglycerol acyltransferase [Nitzschia inconspicua]KAG7370467.1 diacylglycerol acyltransferase [Nitzschia inconspicua]
MCKWSAKQQSAATTRTTEKDSRSHDDDNDARRPIPILSEIIYFPVILLSATFHYLLHPWPQLEATVAMAVMGGFFGFLLIPTAFAYCLTILMETIFGISPMILSYAVWIPFSILYAVQILILDKTHVHVRNSGPPQPRYSLERAAWAFADSIWKYYPSVECIPCDWEEDDNDSDNTKDTAPTTTNGTSSLPFTLDPNQQIIFGVHPHGIHCIPLGQFTAKDSAFDRTFPGLYGPKLTGICATVIFKLPVVRELFFHMGYIDASRSVCQEAMQQGQSLFICVGGEEEAMYTTKGQDIVVLSKRKGFVRLALRYGASLVPVFGVGNTDTYETYSIGLKWRLWLQKKTGIALPIFHGRWFSTLPYPVPIKLLVGEPILTPTPVPGGGGKPDDALVEEYHAKYVEALKKMHSKYVTDRTLIVK